MTYPQVRGLSYVSEGDLNTRSREISPIEGNHEVSVAGHTPHPPAPASTFLPNDVRADVYRFEPP